MRGRPLLRELRVLVQVTNASPFRCVCIAASAPSNQVQAQIIKVSLSGM